MSLTRVLDIFDFLNELAPLSLQMDFDNAGFLLGDGNREVRRALLALDITDAVAAEAAELGAELIVSHHPLIFRPLSSLRYGPETGKLYTLMQGGIAALCFHTNLDIAEGGVNDALAALLGLTVLEPLDRGGCGRIGEFSDSPDGMGWEAFLSLCMDRLQTSGLRYYASGKAVRRVAVMGGAGGSSLKDAWEKGCDTYLTSDLKYHEFLLAEELGINLIDGDHFCTENPVIPVLREKLQKRFPETEFLISRRHRQIVRFIAKEM